MKTALQNIINNSTGEKKQKKIDDISKKSLKIELLKKELEILSEKIKTIKEITDTQTADAKEKMCKSKEEYIYLLIAKFNMKNFTFWEKDIISEFINEEYSILMDLEYSSENLKEAMQTFVTSEIENMDASDKKMAEEMMREMFEEMDIDTSSFTFEEMSSPYFKNRMEKEAAEILKRKEEKNKEKQKEKLVAQTDIDFQKLYKKLAKISHPDLCKDENEKEAKELQMKSLTQAWENRDYYEILMLWLCIDPENTVELELNESNHKKIIAQLNEKINLLGNQKYKIKNYFHDTSFYYKNFYAATEKAIQNKVKKYINELEITTQNTVHRTNMFQKNNTLKKVFKETYDSRNQNDDVFAHFFNKLGFDQEYD